MVIDYKEPFKLFVEFEVAGSSTRLNELDIHFEVVEVLFIYAS
jgi:hypothetical protein